MTFPRGSTILAPELNPPTTVWVVDHPQGACPPRRLRGGVPIPRPKLHPCRCRAYAWPHRARPRRLLIFRTPTGRWEIRLRDLGY